MSRSGEPSAPHDADPSAADQPITSPVADSELSSEDFYFEGPYMVFTAAYHRKRGACCHSDCRHCPYR